VAEVSARLEWAVDTLAAVFEAVPSKTRVLGEEHFDKVSGVLVAAVANQTEPNRL